MVIQMNISCLSLISVIIPVYNSSSYLLDCLNSVLNQSYYNLEIILIDDCSTDDSLSLLNSMIDSRILLIKNSENMGVSYCRNLGLDVCSGDYVLFIDSDDIISSDFILNLYRSLLSSSSDISASNICVYDVLTHNHFYPFEKFCDSFLLEGDALWSSYLSLDLSIAVWGKLYKRSLISNLRFIPSDINEDFVFSFELFKRCSRLVIVNSSIYTYHVGISNSLKGQSFCLDNFILLSHADEVLSYVNMHYPALSLKGLSYWYACNIHLGVLYIHYLSLNPVNLYFSYGRYLLDNLVYLSCLNQCFDSYIVESDSVYDISYLISVIKEYLC